MGCANVKAFEEEGDHAGHAWSNIPRDLIPVDDNAAKKKQKKEKLLGPKRCFFCFFRVRLGSLHKRV